MNTRHVLTTLIVLERFTYLKGPPLKTKICNNFKIKKAAEATFNKHILMYRKIQKRNALTIIFNVMA
jgi:hypothetical protein